LQRLPPDLPAVFVHRTGVLPDSHVQVGDPTRTVMVRSLVDAAAWARTDDEARTIIAAGCQQRRVTSDELLEIVAQLPRARRRSLVVETARDAAGGATALSEIDFIRLCRRAKLPIPDLQERRTDASGRIRYLDAYWHLYRLHVEVDGAHHMDAGQWEADMRRQNDVWISGDRILRFSAWQVRHRPAEVIEQLQRALNLAARHPI
jgi:very-short-patch-repair endonuclease